MGLQMSLFLLYVYNSFRYISTHTEKIQYYTTAIVPFNTVAFYTMALATYGSPIGIPSPPILNFFFIEWMVVTPLLIVNIGRALHMPLYSYLLLSTSAIGMNLCGYLAHNLSRPLAFGAFAVGGVCYSYALLSLTYMYYYRNRAEGAVTVTRLATRNNDMFVVLHIAKILITSVYCVWSLYPVCFLLYIFEAISLDSVIIAFVVLDFISKGVFTCVLIGYYNYVNQTDSFLQWLIRPRRVYPLPIGQQGQQRQQTQEATPSPRVNDSTQITVAFTPTPPPPIRFSVQAPTLSVQDTDLTTICVRPHSPPSPSAPSLSLS